MWPRTPSLHIVSNSALQLSWSAVPGADLYGVIVYDGETKYLDWPSKSLLASGSAATAGSATSVLIEGLQPGIAYKAKVAARREGTWSGYSEFSAEVRLPAPCMPQVPSVQKVNCSTLRVSWAEVPGARLYGVIVHDGKTKYFDWTTQSLVLSGSEANPGLGSSVLVEGLKPGVPYKAKVAAQHGSAWSEYSAFSVEVTLPKPTKPHIPSLHTVDSSTLQMSWSAVPGADLYGVIVHDGETKYLDWPTKLLLTSGAAATAGSATSVQLEGLSPGIPYRAKVAARQGGVWGDYSEFSPEVRLFPTPEVPVLERVNDSMLVVSWSEVPGAERYDVIVNDGETKQVNWQTNLLETSSSNTQAGSATSVLVKGLDADLPYKAKVAALQGGVWSDYSTFSDVTRLGVRVSADAHQARKRSQEQTCVVCLNRHAQVALDPCGHFCACAQCAATFERCPICRGNISKRLRVYGC